MRPEKKKNQLYTLGVAYSSHDHHIYYRTIYLGSFSHQVRHFIFPLLLFLLLSSSRPVINLVVLFLLFFYLEAYLFRFSKFIMSCHELTFCYCLFTLADKMLNTRKILNFD